MAKKSLETFKLEAWMTPHIRAITVSVAKEVLREEQFRGFDKKPMVFVDRRPGLPFEAVRAFGRIEILERANMGDIIEYIFKMLHKKSPVGDVDYRPGHPGFYRNSHLIFVNALEVTKENVHQINFDPSKDTVRFLNDAIYARKLEGIYTKARFNRKTNTRTKSKWHTFGWSPQAPRGVYRVVARMAKQKFGRNVSIRFTARPLQVGGAQVRRWWKGGKKLKKFEMTNQVYPTIEVTANTGGIII